MEDSVSFLREGKREKEKAGAGAAEDTWTWGGSNLSLGFDPLENMMKVVGPQKDAGTQRTLHAILGGSWTPQSRTVHRVLMNEKLSRSIRMVGCGEVETLGCVLNLGPCTLGKWAVDIRVCCLGRRQVLFPDFRALFIEALRLPYLCLF